MTRRRATEGGGVGAIAEQRIRLCLGQQKQARQADTRLQAPGGPHAQNGRAPSEQRAWRIACAQLTSWTSEKRLVGQPVQWTSDGHADTVMAGSTGGGRANEGGQLQRGTTGSRHTRAGVAAEFKAQAATATGLRRRLGGRRRTSRGRPVAS